MLYSARLKRAPLPSLFCLPTASCAASAGRDGVHVGGGGAGGGGGGRRDDDDDDEEERRKKLSLLQALLRDAVPNTRAI